MKKIALVLAAIAYSFSAPTYYTFTGKVTFLVGDVGGYAASHGIHAGSPVTYIFAVDTSRNAYTRFDGITDVKPDSINVGTGYRADYFFDSLIAPSLFSPAVTDTASGSYLGYHTATIIEMKSRYSLAFQTMIGNPDHGTQILFYLPDSGFVDFMPKVGTAVSASESYLDSSAASFSASLSMTLTAISNTRPSNGLRPIASAASSWFGADLDGESLLLRNHSGNKAAVRVMDASGKTVVTLSMGEKAALPASHLPRGKFFLEVTSPGRGGPVMQAFYH